jgi:enterochelin esterase-like enzyme
VVLLLHGGGGHADEFRDLGAADLATTHQMILVAPEGETTGFLDAAADPGDRPGLALADSLLQALEQRYAIARTPRDRAILGVSLGGFAALSAGLDHPARFGFAGALSGVIEWPEWGASDLRFLPLPMQQLYLRAFGNPEDPARLRFSLFRKVDRLAAPTRGPLPFLYLACGQQDLFAEGSQLLAEKLDRLAIPHAYTQPPGGHDSADWRQELAEALKAYEQWRRVHAAETRLGAPLSP